MAKEVSLIDLRRMNMTQIVLGNKKIRDRFVSHDEVRKSLTDNNTIIETYDTEKGSLDDYDVVDDFRRKTQIEVFEKKQHGCTNEFTLHIEDGRVDDESYRITRIDFVIDGTVEERIFIK